jgi:hypothetical protein
LEGFDRSKGFALNTSLVSGLLLTLKFGYFN